MSAIESLIKIPGLYVISADGTIGATGDDGRIEVDPAASSAWATHTARFLAHCSADPAGAQRIAIIYRSGERKPWGSDTLVLDERVVRELYPVSGPPPDELTAFQRKSRENS